MPSNRTRARPGTTCQSVSKAQPGSASLNAAVRGARPETPQADRQHHRAHDISEWPGNQTSMVTSYGQPGTLETERRTGRHRQRMAGQGTGDPTRPRSHRRPWPFNLCTAQLQPPRRPNQQVITAPRRPELPNLVLSQGRGKKTDEHLVTPGSAPDRSRGPLHVRGRRLSGAVAAVVNKGRDFRHVLFSAAWGVPPVKDYVSARPRGDVVPARLGFRGESPHQLSGPWRDQG